MFSLNYSFFFYFYILNMNRYLICFLITLIFFILLKNSINSSEKFNNSEILDKIKIYNDYELSNIRNTFSKFNKYPINQLVTDDYFDKIKNKNDYNYQHITNDMNNFLYSDFIHKIKDYKLDNNRNLQGFLLKTKHNISFSIKFNVNKELLQNNKFFIKYEIIDKNTSKKVYENYTYFSEKINSHSPISNQNIVNLANKETIAFERPINLDGKYYESNDKEFEIIRHLYLSEGDYSFKYHFLSDEEELLKNIFDVEVVFSKNLPNDYINQNEIQIEQNIKNYNNLTIIKNYFSELYLIYKLRNLIDILNIAKIDDFGKIDTEDSYEKSFDLTYYKLDIDFFQISYNNYPTRKNYYLIIIIVLHYIYTFYSSLNPDVNKCPSPSDCEKVNNFIYTKMFENINGSSLSNKLMLVSNQNIEIQVNENSDGKKTYEEVLETIKEQIKNFNLNIPNKQDLDKILDTEIQNDNQNKCDEKCEVILKQLFEFLLNLRKNEKMDVNLKGVIINFDLEYKYEQPILEDKYKLLDNKTPSLYIKDLLKLIQTNFKKIYGPTRGYLNDVDFDDLIDDKMKYELEDIYNYSKMYIDENKMDENYKAYEICDKIVKIINNLVDYLIVNNDINSVNKIVNMNFDNYKFPDEIIIIENYMNQNDINKNIQNLNEKLKKIVEQRRNIKNNKMFKKKSNNNIEEFMNPHKHTGSGQVIFPKEFKSLDIDNAEWYAKNKNLITDYSYLDTENKDDILKSLNNLEKQIFNSNHTIKSLVNSYANYRPNDRSNNVKSSIELVNNDLNKAISDSELAKYKNIEIAQENRIKNINEKIIELENIQNKIYTGNNDSYKSIRSLSDGHTLSVENKDNNNYSLSINNQCLNFNEPDTVSQSNCQFEESQYFNIRDIKNNKEYNNLLMKKENDKPIINEYSNIRYPFQVVNPVNNEKKCVTMEGNSIGVSDCNNSQYQRWEAMKFEKNCSNND